MKYTPLILMLAPIAGLVAQAETVAEPRDDQGRTPLMLALMHWECTPETVKALLESGADVNARDNQGNTPLMLAPSVRYYDHEMRSGLPLVRMLVEGGADVHALNADGMNVLELASCQKDMPDEAVLAYLRSFGLEMSLNGKLAEACAQNDVNKVREYLAAGADPNFARSFPLYICMSEGTHYMPHDAEIIELLLKAGANPNLRARGIMHCCAHGGPSLHLFLDAGLDIHLAGDALPDFLARFWICCHGFPKSEFSRMIRLGADVNAVSMYGPLLCIAAKSPERDGRREIAYLLSIGANPTLKDSQGRTALDIARELGRTDIIPMLENPSAPHPITTHGVDVPKRGFSRCGGTPLTHAAQKGDLQQVKALLDAGADTEALRDAWQGRTALWEAMFHGHLQVAKVLVEHKARIHKIGTSERGVLSTAHARGAYDFFDLCWGLRDGVPGECGRTALHEAAFRGDVDCAAHLAWRKQEKNAVDDAGNTPLHLLEYATPNYVLTAQELVKNGASVNARNHKGETPLHCMQGVRWDWIEAEPTDALVGYLISAGADVHARTNAGLNALDLAMCLPGSWQPGSPDPVKESPNPVVRLLLKNGLTVSQHALLIGAAAANDIEGVKRALASGANPNAYGKDAPNALAECLSTACDDKPHEKEIVQLLLQNGADPNLASRAILHRARWGTPEIIEMMFAHGLQLSNVPKEELRNLMARVLHQENLSYYQLLLQQGAPAWNLDELAVDMRAAVESADERAIYRVHNLYFPMQTPMPGFIPAPFADGQNTGGDALMLACALGQADIVRVLLSMECNVEGTDAAGRTPLEYAAAHGYDDLVYLLLNAGAQRIPEALKWAELYGRKHTAGILREFVKP